MDYYSFASPPHSSPLMKWAKQKSAFSFALECVERVEWSEIEFLFFSIGGDGDEACQKQAQERLTIGFV